MKTPWFIVFGLGLNCKMTYLQIKGCSLRTLRCLVETAETWCSQAFSRRSVELSASGIRASGFASTYLAPFLTSTIGALIITYTILGVPYYLYSSIIRPLYYKIQSPEEATGSRAPAGRPHRRLRPPRREGNARLWAAADEEAFAQTPGRIQKVDPFMAVPIEYS